MVTFSLCMIVKNEEAVLRRCLDSFAPLMDEIIIIDTGSTDATRTIALEYTDKVFDYSWSNDFAEARNFAFSHASMDYIYSADADEYIDAVNTTKLAELKQTILPEVELVQMYYVTPGEYNTTSNFLREYRPKLFRRLRPFIWIDAVHETVRLEPVIYDSTIEITHCPQSLHTGRDFEIFHSILQKQGTLSDKLHSMYAKELFISGSDEDFLKAEDVFLVTMSTWQSSAPRLQEAGCVLSRIYRCKQESELFFSTALGLIHRQPCSEIACEIGTYFYEKGFYMQAADWFLTAASEFEPAIDARTHGVSAYLGLSVCYQSMAEETKKLYPDTPEMTQDFEDTAVYYREQAENWKLPEE